MKRKLIRRMGHIVGLAAVLAIVGLGAGAGVARADYLYTFSSDISGYIGSAQFSESSILTSTTTISGFSSDTFSNLTSLTLAPESGESCYLFYTGPCIAASFANGGGTNVYSFSSNLTSPGTYNTIVPGNRGSLQISAPAAAPEPGSLTLLGVVLLAVLTVLWIERRPGIAV